MNPKTKVLYIRIPSTLHNTIKEKAIKECRTINTVTRLLLELALKIEKGEES